MKPALPTIWALVWFIVAPVSGISAQSNARPVGQGCDTVALQRGTRPDTAGLTRKIYEGPVDGSSEGAAVIAYSDARGLRLLVVDFLGETGKVTYHFRMVDPANYIVDRVESDYNAPITDPTFSGVARSAESRMHICSGRPVGRDQGEFFKDASEVLASAMELVSE